MTYALVAAAACALAACESSAPTEPTPATGGAVARDAPAAAAAKPDAPVAAPEVAVLADPDTPVINADPERLLGMDSGALTDVLGTPAFVRDDSPAQLWRYRDGTCLLDVFLYTDPESYAKRFTVKHYAVRATGEGSVSAAACLKNLLLARMTKPAS